VAYLARVVPVERFASILHVPCGDGRHLAGLRELGYRCVGVDADEGVVAEARGLTALAAGPDRDLVLACRDFDECLDPSLDRPRMQLVFGRSGNARPAPAAEQPRLRG
jgi:hypothetical protein